ncbi:MAG TPA: isocitrate lyase/PEP mutase family protein [Bordetella sp.]|nr:isocitrate lyase/PEP mutase family protein [Bordetella sp.]
MQLRLLKELINAPEILVTPGIYDGFSARVVEKMGFKTATISGAGISESRLGLPDRGIMGLTDNVDTCSKLANCTSLLLQADADTGYGNEVNVYFTTQAFEKAGAAAIMIEDQVFPKRCGHMAGKEVVAAGDMVKKVRAAVAARRNPDFVIKARTDAAGPLGVEEAIRRLNLYAEAGADCLFADALTSEADIERVARSVPRPLSVNMGLGLRSRNTTPLLTPARLRDLGVAQVSYPRLLSAASLRGMLNAMQVFQTDVLEQARVVERPDLMVSFEEICELMGLRDIEQLEASFQD